MSTLDPAISHRPLCHPRSNKSLKHQGPGKQSLNTVWNSAITFSIFNSMLLLRRQDNSDAGK